MQKCIEEAAAWERSYVRGECSLADALMMTLHIGAPASSTLIAALENAFLAYNRGQVDDLAEAFGCAVARRDKKKMEHETVRSNVKFHVEAFRAQGDPLVNPNDYPEKTSAFTKTAELLGNVSATTAFNIYYDRDIKARKPSR
jgi:hypothetical protein